VEAVRTTPEANLDRPDMRDWKRRTFELYSKVRSASEHVHQKFSLRAARIFGGV